MIRPLMIAAMLAVPVLPALAQTHVLATQGALAGRSPVQAYRTAAATPACAKQMHSLPAGKLPTYGTHAMAPAACADTTMEVAAADAKREARN